MSKKKMIFAVIAGVLAVALMVGLFIAARPKTTQGQKTFTVTVVYEDGTDKDFTYTSEDLYLGQVLQAEGLVEGEMADYGLYIKAVDGVKAVYEEDNAYWGIFVGEESAVTGIDQIPIEDGASYKLVYTPAQ